MIFSDLCKQACVGACMCVCFCENIDGTFCGGNTDDCCTSCYLECGFDSEE